MSIKKEFQKILVICVSIASMITCMYLFVGLVLPPDALARFFTLLILGVIYVPTMVFYVYFSKRLIRNYIMDICAKKWGYQVKIFLDMRRSISISLTKYESLSLDDITNMTRESLRYTNFNNQLNKASDDMKLHMKRLCILMCIHDAITKNVTLDPDVYEFRDTHSDEYILIKMIGMKGDF